MITVKNLNYIIKILQLIRNSTALMELINSKDLSENLNNIIGTNLSVENKSTLSEYKQYVLSSILAPENIYNIVNSNNLNLDSEELAINFVLDKLYDILKEYSETKFDEENPNNDNN